MLWPIYVTPWGFTLSVNEIQPSPPFLKDQKCWHNIWSLTHGWIWLANCFLFIHGGIFNQWDLFRIPELTFVTDVYNQPVQEMKHFRFCWECLVPFWLSQNFTQLPDSTQPHPLPPAKLGLVRMRTSSIVIRRRSRTAPASPWTPGTRRSSSPSASCSPPACWWRRGCWSECRGCRWCERQIWRPTSRVTPASGFTTS